MQQPQACQQQLQGHQQWQQLIIRKLLWLQVSPTLQEIQPTTKQDQRIAMPTLKWLLWQQGSR